MSLAYDDPRAGIFVALLRDARFRIYKRDEECVCDALKGVPEILVTGARQSHADFRHYVEKHRPQLMPAIKGWEVSEHLSDAQLVALGRKYFDQLNRVPPPRAAGA